MDSFGSLTARLHWACRLGWGSAQLPPGKAAPEQGPAVLGGSVSASLLPHTLSHTVRSYRAQLLLLLFLKNPQCWFWACINQVGNPLALIGSESSWSQGERGNPGGLLTACWGRGVWEVEERGWSGRSSHRGSEIRVGCFKKGSIGSSGEEVGRPSQAVGPAPM